MCRLMLIIFFISFKATAIEWHYVITDLPPDVVYVHGIAGPGDDSDVLHHLSGIDVARPVNDAGHRQTGFITTVRPLATAPVDRVAQVAMDVVGRNPSHTTLYIYAVRPDDSFYPAIPSIDAYNRVNPAAAWPTTGANIQLLAGAWGMHINRAGINGANIYQARQVQYNVETDRADIVTMARNTYYMDLDTNANTQGYPTTLNDISTTTRQRVMQFLSGGSVAAAILSATIFRKYNDHS